MLRKQSTDNKVLNEAAGLLKALADSNRLRILNVLMERDSCNCELNDMLGLKPNLLSHHLRVLRQAGLINSRKDAIDGRWIYYAVDKETITSWQNWFTEFFDLTRLQDRPVLCGPEGLQQPVDPSFVVLEEATP